MSLSQHLHRHGFVHAYWTISVLLAVIAWLLLRSPNGAIIGTYIGFASSVASLLLALVAIGYAFISNQSFGETIGSLRSSSDSLHSAARNIADTTELLNERMEDVAGDVARVPAVVQELSAKLDAQTISSATSRPESLSLSNKEDEKTAELLNRVRYGTQVGLYTLAKSFVARKAFNSSELVKDPAHEVWNGIITGFILAIQDLEPCGIEVAGFFSGSSIIYTVSSLGSLDAGDIIAHMSREDKHGTIEQIDKYFEE